MYSAGDTQSERGRERGEGAACKPDSFKDCAVGTPTWVKCDGKIYAKNAAAICATAATTTTARLYNKTKALQTEHTPPALPPLTTWHTKSEKDEQGRLRRRFLQDFFMEYGLVNNFMGNANATQTGKAFARLQLQPPALSAGPADAQCVNK